MLKIRVSKGDEDPIVKTFDETEVSVGREDGNELVLVAANISKRHARFVVERDHVVSLIDNQSTNGTFVNGKRITGKVRLEEGQKAFIGDYVLEIIQASAASSGTEASSSIKKLDIKVSLDPFSEVSPQPKPTLDPLSSVHHPLSEPFESDAPAPAPRIPDFDDWGPAASGPLSPILPDPKPIRPGSYSDIMPSRPPSDPFVAPLIAPPVLPEAKPRFDEVLPPPRVESRFDDLVACLKRYVEIDELSQTMARGRSCDCGKCLLCRSRSLLAKSRL